MHEAIITEKTEVLKSLTTKENYIKILQSILIPLWNVHSIESFNQICTNLDNQIKLLQNENS
jgi:hypothetical protein